MVFVGPAGTLPSVMRLKNMLLAGFGVFAVAVGSTAVSQGSIGALAGHVNIAASATESAFRVNPPAPVPSGPELPERPRVFMALTGNKQLANNPALDHQWSYVQEHLDGIWGNPVGLDAQEIGRIFDKVDTRQFIGESALPPHGSAIEVQTFEYLEQHNPGLLLEREGIALYTDQPGLWDGRSIADARAQMPRFGPQQIPIYPAVYTGWQPYNFRSTDSRYIRPGSSARRALDEGDGLFVECPSRACAEPQGGLGPEFRSAIEEAHRNGRPFI